MFHPLKDFLDNALKRTGAERSVTASVIVEAAGPILLQLIPNLRPADFKVISYSNGCLTVAVASPPIGQEIKIRAESIVEALQDIFQNKSSTFSYPHGKVERNDLISSRSGGNLPISSQRLEEYSGKVRDKPMARLKIIPLIEQDEEFW